MTLNLTPIAQTPAAPCTVLFFSANRQWWHEVDGERVNVAHPADPKAPYRDERFDLGYWDGETWRWLGTAHEVWEFADQADDPDLPTHYMEIEAP